MSNTLQKNDLYTYVLRQADNSMILCQRLCEWVARGPELEEDLALTNVGLDLIGQARSLYQYAATLSDEDVSEDDLAFMRNERDWVNLLLVEQPNGDYADTIARQFLFDVWHLECLKQLQDSKDETIAAIAAKSIKESSYHLRHSATWFKRLGDGTEESHQRMQKSLDEMWRFTPELFESDDLDKRVVSAGIGVDLEIVEKNWTQQVNAIINEATLTIPAEPFPATGGRKGIHTEHLGYLLAEMQILPRSMPGCQW